MKKSIYSMGVYSYLVVILLFIYLNITTKDYNNKISQEVII